VTGSDDVRTLASGRGTPLDRHDYEADTHTRTSSSTCRRRSPRCAPSSRSCWL